MNEHKDNPPVEHLAEVIKAAAKVLLDATLQHIQDDPHQWSSRPCPTCRAVSSLVGRPFGCLTRQDR